MKKLYLILTLLLAFSFLTCDDDTTKDNPVPQEPPTLDQRLVGGRWYFWNIPSFMPKAENGYYEFKEDMKFIHSDSDDILTEISVYSKNNIVYRKDSNQELLRYGFVTSYPYQNSKDFYIPGDWQIYINIIIGNNNLITCTVSDQNLNLIDDTTAIQYKFLRRFKPDGTAYEN
jgi:hypothetical protein